MINSNLLRLAFSFVLLNCFSHCVLGQTLTAPANITVECDEDFDLQNPAVTGFCTGYSITYEESIVVTDCESIIYRDWTVMDDCGNNETASQTITSVDTTAPIFTNIDIDPANTSAEDNCSQITITYQEEGSVRTYFATDECGNTEAVTINICIPPAVNPLTVVDLYSDHNNLFEIPEPEPIEPHFCGSYSVSLIESPAAQWIVESFGGELPLDIAPYWSQLEIFAASNGETGEYTSPEKKRAGNLTWGDPDDGNGDNLQSFFEDQLVVIEGLTPPVIIGEFLPCELPSHPFSPSVDHNEYHDIDHVDTVIQTSDDGSETIVSRYWTITKQSGLGSPKFYYTQLYKVLNCGPIFSGIPSDQVVTCTNPNDIELAVEVMSCNGGYADLYHETEQINLNTWFRYYYGYDNCGNESTAEVVIILANSYYDENFEYGVSGLSSSPMLLDDCNVPTNEELGFEAYSSNGEAIIISSTDIYEYDWNIYPALITLKREIEVEACGLSKTETQWFGISPDYEEELVYDYNVYGSTFETIVSEYEDTYNPNDLNNFTGYIGSLYCDEITAFEATNNHYYATTNEPIYVEIQEEYTPAVVAMVKYAHFEVEYSNGDFGLPNLQQKIIFYNHPNVCALEADLNYDFQVNTSDLILLLSEFSCSSCTTSDIDTSGAVDVSDLLILLSEFGLSC